MNREQRRRHQKRKKSARRAGNLQLDGDTLRILRRAQQLFEAGDFAAAEDLCQDVSAAAPLVAEPFHLRALANYRMGRIGKAGEMILEAITRNDDDPEIHANCGAIMNMLGRYPEAEAACRHVIELDPRRADGYSNLAVSLEMQGRISEAIEACHQALKIQPDYPEARINLGNLLVRSDDLIGAVESYAQAIELTPDNPTALANMSVALLRLDEAEAAEEHARGALALNPEYLEGLNALGNALAGQQRFDEAIAAFDKALSLRPGSYEAANNRAAALHKSGDCAGAIEAYRAVIVDGKAPAEIFAGLGVALLADGKAEDAVEAFRKAIAVKPELGDAWYNLASALGSGMPETEQQQLTSLLERTDLADKDKIPLYFAHGEIADKCGQYETAFAAFSAGNALRKSGLRRNEIAFDADAFDREVEDLIKAYPAGFQSSISGPRSASTKPVFIVGMPRSGTTLVEQIIAAHPQAKSLGEAATLLGVDLDDEDAGGDVLTRVERRFAAVEDCDVVVDKTPFHFLSVGAIERVFPKARVLHCQRSPEDVLVSCFFQNFVAAYAWATDLDDIRRYMKAEQRLMDHWKHVCKIPIQTVGYEALVGDPETVMPDILAFLGLEWDDRCRSYFTYGGRSLSASNWQVRKPIYNSSVDRWQNYSPFIGASPN